MAILDLTKILNLALRARFNILVRSNMPYINLGLFSYNPHIGHILSYNPIYVYISIIHIWRSLALGQIWILETKTYIVYMGKTFRLYFFYNPCIWHSLALGQIQIIEKIWPQYFSHINPIYVTLYAYLAYNPVYGR